MNWLYPVHTDGQARYAGGGRLSWPERQRSHAQADQRFDGTVRRRKRYEGRFTGDQYERETRRKASVPSLESRTEVGSVLEGSCSIAFDGPYERWQVGADGIASTSSYIAAISCGHPLAVSPDGRWLVTLACERIGRNFDESEWRMVYGDAPYCKTCLA
jgi:hypothetical protein